MLNTDWYIDALLRALLITAVLTCLCRCPSQYRSCPRHVWGFFCDGPREYLRLFCVFAWRYDYRFALAGPLIVTHDSTRFFRLLCWF